MATKTKRKQIEQNEAKAILDSVKDIKIDDVVLQVSNLQVTVQKTLADLCGTVTTKVQQMEQLDNAIDLKNTRLQELHDIEKEAISLDELRLQYEIEEQNHLKSCEEQRRKWTEEIAEEVKKRQRDEENWKYSFEQSKKRFKEEFDAEVAKAKRDEQVRKDSMERNWIERENALQAKEKQFNEYKAAIEGFDAKLETAKKAGETAGFASASAKYTHEIALLKKDSESAKAIAEMRAVSLTEQISTLSNQIEDLQKQLLTARADAKEVASEAIKGASNRQLAETLQKVVTDQQTPNKAK